MQCHDFREIADSYLGDELLIETNHEMHRHLQSCDDCRRELAARRELRMGLRAAFDHAEEWQIRDEFAARLNVNLQARAEQAEKAPLIQRGVWLALAACLLIAALLGLSVLRPRAPTPYVVDAGQGNSNQSGAEPLAGAKSPASPSPAVDVPMVDVTAAARAVLAALAAGVHRDCGVAHKIEEMPIDLAEAGRKYDRAYLDLTRAVMSRQKEFAGPLKLVMAHSCVFGGRRYGHVVLEHQGRLISVLVTDLDRPRDSTAQPAPSLADADRQAVACAPAAGYQVSCFETARHAVFVVSDFAEAENLAVARRLAPSISQHIARAEAKA